MALEIPKEEISSILQIKALPKTSLAKFISVLEDAEPVSDPREMAARISKQLPTIPTPALEEILGVLYTLYQIRELSGVRPDRFLQDLMDAIRRNQEIQAAAKDLPEAEAIFKRLLSISTLNIVAKALRLQRDGERLYCTAKILSDIRPVFGDDPSADPLGTVLTHTLKVAYHEGKDHREVHIILDSNDLVALGDVVQRAKAKDKTLRKMLKRFKLPRLDE